MTAILAVLDSHRSTLRQAARICLRMLARRKSRRRDQVARLSLNERRASLADKQPGADDARTQGRAAMAKSGDRRASGHAFEAVAGNGLIDRRALLGRGVV